MYFQISSENRNYILIKFEAALNIDVVKNKVKWAIRRHPVLYYMRFAMICENISNDLKDSNCFNSLNDAADVAPIFQETFNEINLSGKTDLEKSLTISKFLTTKIIGGPGLGLSSDGALHKMLNGRAGVCSDFSQIYNVFCLLAGIKVREYGVVEKFYNPQFGHTFNEIYSRELQKWVMLDVGKGIYYRDKQSQQPLSAMEIFLQLREAQEPEIVYFTPRKDDQKRLDQIYSSESIPFLITNYSNKTYDYYFNKYQEKVPGFLINFWLIVLRKNFKFSFMLDDYKKFF